jgi:hypothetical protein
MLCAESLAYVWGILMNDFKVGDKIYCFPSIMAELSVDFDVTDIWLHMATITFVGKDYVKAGGEVIYYPYHSRREALNALASRLKFLLDEDGVSCWCKPEVNYICGACLNP